MPDGVDLGVPDALMQQHMALDIGVDPLARAIAAQLGCPAIVATVSRLVVDLTASASNCRDPIASDGHPIPGNAILHARAARARLERFWDPITLIADMVDALARILFACTASRPGSPPGPRKPWEVGILYNPDGGAHSRSASRRGIPTGDRPIRARISRAMVAEARAADW